MSEAFNVDDLAVTDSITVLHHATINLAKTWQADGSITPYDNAKEFSRRVYGLAGIRALSALLADLERQPRSCVIRGVYNGPEELRTSPRRREFFTDALHHWVLIEVDEYEPVCADPVLQPEEAITEFIVSSLPPEFWEVTCHWQLSNSAGHPKNAGKLKVHLWFWMARAYDSDQLKRWAKGELLAIDRAVLNVVQVHYTAAPQFAEGVTDPVPRRSGLLEGVLGDDVYLDIPDQYLTVPEPISGAGEGRAVLGTQIEGALAALIAHYNMLGSCPREEWLHIGMAVHYETAGSAEGMLLWDWWSAQIPGYEGIDDIETRWNSFDESGSGGMPITGGTLLKLAREAGWDDPVTDDDFIDGSVVPAAGMPVAPAAPAPLITAALHPCTDQANAVRLVRAFKTRIMVVGGRWYAWTGRYWEANEGVVYNHDMKLSAIIHREIEQLYAALEVRVTAWMTDFMAAAGAEFDPAQFDAKRFIDDQIRTAPAKRNPEFAADVDVVATRVKWAAKSESKVTLEAALGLAKKVLEVDPDKVDSNPWLFNCVNGTVDLRTGELQPHNPDDYITRMAPIAYDPAATAPEFERVLAMITREDGHEKKPLADFLQRWFGYCITGSVREQKFVVHWGGGGNGKSLLLETIAAVVGEYASTAAPGLMTGDGERNLAAIADLMGRRMVTASESDEGANLREGQVKQITGSDSLKGRHLYAQLVEFKPTHKVQLLTNHKPVIKGTDEGIWRRVLLMPYRARFGTAEEVAAGTAQHVKDVGLLESLRTEYPGILTWLVHGAMAWYCEGLREPAAVHAASVSYRAEQDRIATYINDCCELGADFWAALGGTYMFDERPSLYQSYTSWCKDCGFHPLSIPKFEAELERAVPNFYKEARVKMSVEGGKRKNVARIFGIRTLGSEV